MKNNNNNLSMILLAQREVIREEDEYRTNSLGKGCHGITMC